MPRRTPAANPETNRHQDPSTSASGNFPLMIDDLAQLPRGAHCLELHASEDESAEHAAAFLAGADDPNAASYWVADDKLLAFNRERVARRDTRMVQRVRRLDGPQAVPTDGHLRPTGEVIRFVQAHPEGVTAAGATITRYWTRAEIPAYLEYEEWFQAQARDKSRFLCPYDLRRVPVDMAAHVLPELATHHSHLVLSRVPNPMALLLQFLVFPSEAQVPQRLREALSWCVQEGLLELRGPQRKPTLALKGEAFAEAFHSFEERILSGAIPT